MFTGGYMNVVVYPRSKIRVLGANYQSFATVALISYNILHRKC